MNYIPNECVTIGMGICASMAAFLLSSGQKEKRFALKYTKIMIHQPLGGAQGQASDIKIMAEEIIKTKKILNTICLNKPIKIYQSLKRIRIEIFIWIQMKPKNMV